MKKVRPTKQEKQASNDIRATRLYELLKHLKPKQRQTIKEIATLDNIPINSERIIILTAIVEHIKKGKDIPLSKEVLMQQCGIQISAQFNHATSDLFKYVCKVLHLFNLRKDKSINNTLALSSFFIENKLPINAKHALHDLKNLLQKKRNRTDDFHFQNMKYHEIYLQRDRDNRKAHDEHFRKTNHALDAFYVKNKLRLLCEQLNRNRIVQETSTIFPSVSFRTAFMELLHENIYFQCPLTKSYFLIYQMLLDNAEKKYLDAAKQIKQQAHHFSANVEETMIAYLMNQCIYFINNNINRSYYASEYVDYIDLLERKNYLFQNKQLSPSKFQAILLAGLIANRTDWAIDFITEKATRLNSPHEDFIKKIHFSYLYFYLDEIDKAYSIIATVGNHQTVDPFFKIFYYKLMIQIYYSRGDLLAVQQTCNAFMVYIYRKNKKNIIAPDKIQRTRNFISYISQIVSFQLDPNRKAEKYEVLKKQILENKGNIAYSDWIEKIITS